MHVQIYIIHDFSAWKLNTYTLLHIFSRYSEKRNFYLLTGQSYLAMSQGMHHLNTVQSDQQVLSDLQESCNVNHTTNKNDSPMHLLHVK